MSNTIEIRKRTPEEIEEKLHEMIVENVILKSTLKEIREYIEKHTNFTLNEFDYISTSPREMLEILDRVKID